MWQTPKTDWTANDTFSAAAYNRIIGNVAHLRDMALTLYPTFETEGMGADKITGEYIYADEINAIETNLARICAGTYPFAIGEQKTHYPSRPAANHEDYNRIESACLLIYNNLTGQESGKKRLSTRLGTRAFGNRR